MHINYIYVSDIHVIAVTQVSSLCIFCCVPHKIHGFVSGADLEIVKMLVQYGASVDVQSDHGDSPLMSCSWQTNKDIINILIENTSNINLQDNDGYTALHHAAMDGNCYALQSLVQAGADVNLQNHHGETPLLKACMRNKFEAANILLDHEDCTVNLTDERRNAPIHYAAYYGSFKTITKLMRSKANLDIRNIYGVTPLMDAVLGKQAKCVFLLMHAGIDLDVRSCGGHNQYERVYNEPKSAVEAAFTLGCPQIGQLLILAGADLKNEAWLWERDFPERMKHHRYLIAWLEKTAMPFSLKKLCRITIRKFLGRRMIKVAGQLEIPKELISFLKMTDIRYLE